MKDVLINLGKQIIFKVLPTLVFGVVVIFVYKKLGFENFLKLVQVLVWPLILIMGMFFFRKVFTYLFFSMDEFNFFGNKGKLKNIQDVISEHVKKLREQEIEKENNKKELEKIQSELENTRQKGVKTEEQYNAALDKVIKIAEELLGRNQKLTEEIDSKDKMIRDFEEKQSILKLQTQAI